MKLFFKMAARRHLLLGSLGVLVLFAIAVFSGQSRAAATPTETVTIREDTIVIHPGAKIDKADVKAMNKILSKYDKSLYKIQTFRGGKVVRTQGKLADVLIDKIVMSEAAEATSSGSSDRTLQVIAPGGAQPTGGQTTNPQQTPGTTTNPQQTPGTTTNPQQTPGATTNPQQTPGTTTNPQQTPGTTTNPQQTPGATTNPHQTPGTTTNPQTSPSTTTNPQKPPGTTTNPHQHSPSPVGADASRELIERLKPILEKYSNK